jgi:hypothetical protein
MKKGKQNNWGSAVADADNFEGNTGGVQHTPNTTGFKDRGYGVGSVFSEAGVNEVYQQEGMALRKDGEFRQARDKAKEFDMDAYNAMVAAQGEQGLDEAKAADAAQVISNDATTQQRNLLKV